MVRMDLQLFGGHGSLAVGSLSAARSIAKEIVSMAGVTRGGGRVGKSVDELIQWLQNNKVNMTRDMQLVMSRAEAQRLDSMLRRILNRQLSNDWDDYKEQLYQWIMPVVKGRMYMDQATRNELAYGEMGRQTIKATWDRSSHYHLDDFYDELSHVFPGHFPQGEINPSTQFNLIQGTYQQLLDDRAMESFTYRYGRAAADYEVSKLRTSLTTLAWAQREVERMQARERRSASRSNSRKRKK